MTISSATSANTFAGTGTTGPYAYTFRILAATDLLVTKTVDATGVVTTLAYGTDYSVTGVGNASGGTVTTVAVVPAGTTLTVRRVLSLVQPTSIQNQGSYFAKTHETAFDRLTMIDQQQQYLLDRATNIVTLPGAGRGVTSLTNYLANNAMFNVKDYLATGDGTTDDTATIQAAITAAAAVGGTVVFPPGTYRVGISGTYALTVNAACRFLGLGEAVLKFRDAMAVTSEIIRVNTAPTTTTVSNVIVDGLVFDGNQLNQVVGVKGLRTVNFVVQNCRFTGFKSSSLPNASYCVYAGGSASYTSPFAWTSAAPTGFSRGTRVTDNAFVANGGADDLGAEAVLVYLTDGFVVSRNYVDDCLKLCFAIGPNRRGTIADNIVENCTDSGMRIDNTNASATEVRDPQGITITGNVIRKSRRDGIRIDGAHLTVTGNVSEFNTLSGIAADIVIDSIIGDNVCFSNLNHGIQLKLPTLTGYPAHEGVAILDNVCSGNTGNGIQVQGGGQANNLPARAIRIANNRCASNGYQGIDFRDGDSTNVIENNTCYSNGQGLDAPGIMLNGALAGVAGGGIVCRGNRCFDKGATPKQGRGIVVTVNAGVTWTACFIEDNDCSDTPVVPAVTNGEAVREFISGTYPGSVLKRNVARNTTFKTDEAARTAGVLAAGTIITRWDDDGSVLVTGLSTGIKTVTAAYTATLADSTLKGDTTAASFSITLPAASTSKGVIYSIYKTVAVNTLTIDPNAAELINGAATYALTAQYAAVIIQCDGTGWNIIASPSSGAGSVGAPVLTVTANTTYVAADWAGANTLNVLTNFASGTNGWIVLPACSTLTVGQRVTVIRIMGGPGVHEVYPNAADTIMGAAVQGLGGNRATMTLVNSGARWENVASSA